MESEIAYTKTLHISTYNIQIPRLALHRIGVYLAHVPALIALPDISYPQLPGLLLRVQNSDALVFGDNMVLDRQDCLRIHPEPRHLWIGKQNRLYYIEED